MYWTTAVTEAIQKGSLKDYLELCNGQIDQIVTLVRGKLPSMARITLGALIVIDVHGTAGVCWEGTGIHAHMLTTYVYSMYVCMYVHVIMLYAYMCVRTVCT